jgi:hypothetical protein
MIKILKYPIIVFLAVILGGSFHIFTVSVLGWTNPSGTPPSGNTAKPVNIGSGAQTKTGSLTLSGSSLTLGSGNNLQVNGPTAVTGNTTFSGYFWTAGPANFCRKEACSGSACASSCSAANYYAVAIGGSDNRLLNPSSPSTATYRICCKNAD